MSDMEIRLILLQTSIELFASIHDSGNQQAMFWNMLLNIVYTVYILKFTHLLMMIIMDMFIPLQIWLGNTFVSKWQVHFD